MSSSNSSDKQNRRQQKSNRNTTGSDREPIVDDLVGPPQGINPSYHQSLPPRKELILKAQAFKCNKENDLQFDGSLYSDRQLQAIVEWYEVVDYEESSILRQELCAYAQRLFDLKLFPTFNKKSVTCYNNEDLYYVYCRGVEYMSDPANIERLNRDKILALIKNEPKLEGYVEYVINRSTDPIPTEELISVYETKVKKTFERIVASPIIPEDIERTGAAAEQQSTNSSSSSSSSSSGTTNPTETVAEGNPTTSGPGGKPEEPSDIPPTASSSATEPLSDNTGEKKDSDPPAASNNSASNNNNSTTKSGKGGNRPPLKAAPKRPRKGAGGPSEVEAIAQRAGLLPITSAATSAAASAAVDLTIPEDCEEESIDLGDPAYVPSEEGGDSSSDTEDDDDDDEGNEEPALKISKGSDGEPKKGGRKKKKGKTSDSTGTGSAGAAEKEEEEKTETRPRVRLNPRPIDTDQLGDLLMNTCNIIDDVLFGHVAISVKELESVNPKKKKSKSADSRPDMRGKCRICFNQKCNWFCRACSTINGQESDVYYVCKEECLPLHLSSQLKSAVHMEFAGLYPHNK